MDVLRLSAENHIGMLDIFLSFVSWGLLHKLVAKTFIDRLSQQASPHPQTSRPVPGETAQKTTKPSEAVKFKVSAWKGLAFTITTLVGVYCLSHETWTTDPRKYLQGWPESHQRSDYEYWFYLATFGNYIYQSWNLIFEPKQKDFPAMIIHHAATLFLMFSSYHMHLQRIGCIVLILHDCSDPLLEFAKCVLYLKMQKTADFLFASFAVTFFVTRLVLYPYLVIYTAHKYSFYEDGTPYAYGHIRRPLIFASLYILQFLHIYWFYLILRVASKMSNHGGVQGDIRDKDQKKE